MKPRDQQTTLPPDLFWPDGTPRSRHNDFNWRARQANPAWSDSSRRQQDGLKGGELSRKRRP